MAPIPPEPPSPTARWLILVAQDQPALFEHLRVAFRGDAKVEVVLDRGAGDTRHPRWVNDRLRANGVVIIRMPE